MTTVRVEETEDEIRVYSPYQEDFPREARAIGGDWNASDKSWKFDLRDREQVHRVLADVYGWAPPSGDTVTVRVNLGIWSDEETAYAFGRQLARKYHRDQPPVLGDGVVVVEGELQASCGSMKYPKIGCSGVIVEVRDVPRRAFERVGDSTVWELVSEQIDADALRNERADLARRIAEIDELLEER